MSQTERIFELGKLYCDRGDFHLAIEQLKVCSEEDFKQGRFDQYLKAINLLLRVYAEREQFEEINQTKEKLQDLVLKEGFQLNSKTYYTLALCASYKGQNEVALDYLQKSLAIALASDNKEDICYAINGIAIVYNLMGRFEDALKEIYNLEVFFQVLEIPELRISSKLINSVILRKLKKYEQALDVLWSAYDDLKHYKHMFLTMNILTTIGITLFEMGDMDLASVYFNLSSKAIDPKNAVRLHKVNKKYLDMLGSESHDAYDLIFNLENHSVTERKLGKIDFKNQFILLDLLKMFIQNQGHVYSKEYLVEHVWKQPYDPAVHDNKIYVTIKRLRKMLEPDYDKPKYIFRAKNGYYMNKSARVQIENKA